MRSLLLTHVVRILSMYSVALCMKSQGYIWILVFSCTYHVILVFILFADQKVPCLCTDKETVFKQVNSASIVKIHSAICEICGCIVALDHFE